MPFPRSWPVFIPKDMLANWFELYAEAMELNIWTGTELKSAAYDDKAKRWTVVLKRDDGERVMHPRHVVFCNGVSTIAKSPDLPGLSEFRGTVRHSGDHGSGLDWKGKRALVLGTGTSGHDVAQDLAVSGAAAVSIIQNGPTLVVSLKEAQAPYALYDEEIPFEDCDLIATSVPYPIYERSHQRITADNAEADKALLAGLRKRGFKLTSGPDGTGWQIMYGNRGGGYYFDAGCSQMIVDGRVSLLQFADIDRFCAEGVRMKDGTVHAADLLVLATGYAGQKEAVAPRARRRHDRPHRPGVGLRRGGRTRRHVAADRPTRAVVPRRRTGAVPHLLQGAGAADQGARARDRAGPELILVRSPGSS